jgi:AbrB family looped-hinge helix DNA binding protein
MTSTVSEKGQITITKAIRDELGIGQGWRAVQRRVGDHVEISFLPPRHRRSLRGVLAVDKRRGTGAETDDEFSQACEQAWAEGASARATHENDR